MQEMQFNFIAGTPVRGCAHVGVVASGDLELIMSASSSPTVAISVCTSAAGFQDIWAATLERFYSRCDAQVSVDIHDFGATPGMVLLRLQQALESMREDG